MFHPLYRQGISLCCMGKCIFILEDNNADLSEAYMIKVVWNHVPL